MQWVSNKVVNKRQDSLSPRLRSATAFHSLLGVLHLLTVWGVISKPFTSNHSSLLDCTSLPTQTGYCFISFHFACALSARDGYAFEMSCTHACPLCFAASGLKKTSCPSSGHVRLYGRPRGYLYWSPSMATVPLDSRLSTASEARPRSRHGGVRVGSARCPWTVIVDPGQRINVSLAALLPYPAGASLDASVPCLADLVVEEPSPSKTDSHVTMRANVCKQRRQVLVTSSSNVLQLYVDSPGGAEAPHIAVLLHFTGIASAR